MKTTSKMITKDWITLIEKYSFIDKAEIKGANIFIRYIKDGEQKSKRLPLRVSVTQIQKAILNIKKELGLKHVEKREGKYYIVSG